MLEGAIIGRLSFRRKKAGRKLSGLKMMLDALAAQSLPGTVRIGAVAPLEVLILIAFHRSSLGSFVKYALKSHGL
jgi:hypothetical protein